MVLVKCRKFECFFLLVLQTLKDKKLKTQLASREKLYGKSAKAAAKIEKVKFLLIQISFV